MRRARPYCGENPEPGKDVTESLTPRPELENGQDPTRTCSPPERIAQSPLGAAKITLEAPWFLALGEAMRRREVVVLLS